MLRILTLITLLLTILPDVGRAEDTPFRVELHGVPSEVVLGLTVPLTIRCRSVANEPVVADAWRQTLHLRVYDPDGVRMRWPCEPLQGVASMVSKPGPILPGTELERLEWFCPTKPGRYTLTGVLSANRVKPEEEGQRVWSGLAQSEEFLVDVVEPHGVDHDAYDAFDGDPLATWVVARDANRYGELLRRFPTSTYAAYVAWKKYAMGWAAVETDRAVAVLTLGFEHEKGFASCNAELHPIADGETLLSGASYVQCRDAWLTSALKHHPEIWFADEIRLRLALDQYLLEEKAACSAQLEDLSVEARADVATKASQLLAALRAKGMLDGAPEEQSHYTR